MTRGTTRSSRRVRRVGPPKAGRETTRPCWRAPERRSPRRLVRTRPRFKDSTKTTSAPAAAYAWPRATACRRCPVTSGRHTGDDEEVVLCPALDGDRHLPWTGARNHRSSGGVPALLREVLILELNRRNPGLLIALDGVADVDEAAEAGVGIGDERRLGAASDRAFPRSSIPANEASPASGRPRCRPRCRSRSCTTHRSRRCRRPWPTPCRTRPAQGRTARTRAAKAVRRSAVLTTSSLALDGSVLDNGAGVVPWRVRHRRVIWWQS